jgi:hypothetical protein
VTKPAPTANAAFAESLEAPVCKTGPLQTIACPRLYLCASEGGGTSDGRKIVPSPEELGVNPIAHLGAFACAAPKIFDSRAFMTKNYDVQIIGGGLAGCEAAWQLAQRGIRMRQSEMRGSGEMTTAHQTNRLAELV